MKTIDEIKKKCKDAGLNIYEVVREAKVDKDIVYRWGKSEPKSFVMKKKIEETIEKMSSHESATT